jgi:hypothetical protein
MHRVIFSIFLAQLLLFSCRQSPASLLEQSVQRMITVDAQGTISYGLLIVMNFEDIDKQIVEESFVVENPEQDITWHVEQGFSRERNNILLLETSIHSDNYLDLQGNLILRWRTFFGNWQEIPLVVATIDLPPLDWEAISWQEHELENVRYAIGYWQEYQSVVIQTLSGSLGGEAMSGVLATEELS